MPSARTTLTEVATAMGCLDQPSLDWAVLRRPHVQGMCNRDWEQVDAEVAKPQARVIAEAAFANGEHFLHHPDGLRGRQPLIVEWTGGRKPLGDQAIPADLRIDHVYLLSCKYLSRIVLNTAPARLFDGCLQPGATHDRTDWYESVAPNEHRDLARISAEALDIGPILVGSTLDARARSALKRAFGRHSRLEGEVAAAYQRLCSSVSRCSAERWRAAVGNGGGNAAENLLWRMLRLASGTYFVLGAGPQGSSLRLRVMTPWDWRQRYELRAFDIEPDDAGQPQVRWAATVRDRAGDHETVVHGHVEVRWSHGRFGGPPEAKIYLDTPHAEVPGYVPLN